MSKLITKATKSMHRATLLTYFPQNGMYTVEETTPKKRERKKRHVPILVRSNEGTTCTKSPNSRGLKY